MFIAIHPTTCRGGGFLAYGVLKQGVCLAGTYVIQPLTRPPTPRKIILKCTALEYN